MKDWTGAMKEFSRILVATDFSDHAQVAAQCGANLARRFSAALVIVHVYQPVSYALPPGQVIRTMEWSPDVVAQYQTQLDRLKNEALGVGAPEVSTLLLCGTAAASIVDTARAKKCDLVVMGTRGRTGLGHLFLGSTAEHVIRAAECPVLTVKAPKEAAGPVNTGGSS